MGKILVTGCVHTGTTFTIGLLTRLGYDTSYSEADLEGVTNGLEYLPGIHAERERLNDEWRNKIDSSPPVIKMPIGKRELRPVLRLVTYVDQRGWEVDRVIIMVRDLDARQEVFPWYPVDRLDRNFRRMMLEAAEREWIVHLLAFPKAARDVEYCYRVLQPLSGDFEQFKLAWKKHVKSDVIHTHG